MIQLGTENAKKADTSVTGWSVAVSVGSKLRQQIDCPKGTTCIAVERFARRLGFLQLSVCDYAGCGWKKPLLWVLFTSFKLLLCRGLAPTSLSRHIKVYLCIPGEAVLLVPPPPSCYDTLGAAFLFRFWGFSAGRSVRGGPQRASHLVLATEPKHALYARTALPDKASLLDFLHRATLQI